MKITYPFLISSLLVSTLACNPQDKKKESNKAKAAHHDSVITFADFKKIKGVDNIQEVPFQLFTKLDSVRFYVAPNKDSAYLKVPYQKLDNYYGFEEFDDFYSIHFSINNTISNSIEAFVLKSEFTASFDLTLKGINLNEIRSSTYREQTDFNNKSFTQYGSVEEVTAAEYHEALKSKADEVLIKNPHIILKGNNWISDKDGREIKIQQYENLPTEDGLLSYQYIGYSPFLGLEVFREDNQDANNAFYTFYNPKEGFSMDLFTSGYPHTIPSINRISSISNNNDTGSDFMMAQYFPETKKQINQLYVNFTGFKFSDEKKGFWMNHDTFYAEVYPTTSTPAKNKKQKASYIKIQLKISLF
ncbi:resolvase [Chryseobacterium sp. MYb264]|uniref:resolvase n=1 Tax=Chryseobacterium sp. MYb264 TaxID=2745153 RepID=UPI002E109007|nr:resolvase [Chryseobacterium sp. MYb264]